MLLRRFRLLLVLALLGWNTAHGAAEPAEMLAFTEDANREMDLASQQLKQLLGEARKSGDVEAIECLTARNGSIQILANVGKGAESSLKDALAGGRMARAELEFRKVTVAVSKTRVLLAESQRCASGQDASPGSTSLALNSQNVIPDDFDEVQISDLDVSVSPPQTSPFQ